MKHRKLLISLLFLLLVLTASVGCASGAEPEAALISADNVSGDLIYSIYAGNTVTITGYSGSERNLILPDKIGQRVCRLYEYRASDDRQTGQNDW